MEKDFDTMPFEWQVYSLRLEGHDSHKVTSRQKWTLDIGSFET
jgi:hypothetical protein